MISKKIGRLISMLLVSCMIFSCLAGCGQEEQTETKSTSASTSKSTEQVASTSSSQTSETEVVNGEIPLDYFAGTEISIAIKNRDSDVNVDNYSEKAICKMIEEETGIIVNWIPVAETGASEKTATFLAGDMPDMMIGLVQDSMLIKNADMFYDLSEEGLLETYAPDVYEMYNACGDVAWNYCTLEDGRVPGLLRGEGFVTAAGNYYYINKVWLDQLGLEIPTTTDELYDVLCAFRDNDMDGDGDATNELPMSFCNAYNTGYIWLLADWFGITSESSNMLKTGRTVVDGTVVSTWDTQHYREFLEFSHKLIADGLLDVEGFSQTHEQYQNKIAAGLVGFFGCYAPNYYLGEEIIDNYVWVPTMQAYEDVEYKKTGWTRQFDATAVMQIAADCENVEACLWLWNYLVSDVEVYGTAIYGPKDVAWTLEDGKIKKLEVDKVVYPDGLTSSNYQPSTAIFNVGIVPFINDYDTYYAPKAATENSRQWLVNSSMDYIYTEGIPDRLAVPDEWTEENADVGTELSAYISGFVGESIMNGLSDAQWEKHLKMLEDLDYQRYIELQQMHLDGTYEF